MIFKHCVFLQKAFVQKVTLDLDILEGPRECCYCYCGEDFEFTVYAADGVTEIGKISKQWTGYFNELKGCDVFGINFPRDLEVTKKSLLLGATFLIDYNFFERNIKGKRQRQSKTIGPKLILLGIVIVMHVIFFSIIITGYFLQQKWQMWLNDE